MEIKTNKIMKAFVKKSGDKWMAEEVITHVPYEIMQDYIPLKEGQVVWGRIVEHSNQDRIHQKYFELQNPPPKVSELATLRAESQAKDTRIKELWTDEQVCDFIKWVQIERWHFIEGGKWGHDYKTFSGFPVFTTTSKLLEEYKKQLTK